MKRRHAAHPLSDEEQMARYAYVLGNVPASIADRAYAAAFARLPTARREELVDELRARMPDQPERSAPGDPDAFAMFMRDLHARDAVVSVPGAAELAAGFVESPAIVAYFTTGAGSVTMDQQPPWVHEMAGHDTAPLDGGTMHHRKGVDSGGVWMGI